MPVLKHRDIFSVSDSQTHLLLRMFSEMNPGFRDTYFLLLIKKGTLSAGNTLD